MAPSLIRGEHVIGNVTGRTEAQIVENSTVFQRAGTIVEIGACEDRAAKYQPNEVLGPCNHVVIPWFVNSHPTRSACPPLQLGSPDYPLELCFASHMAAPAVPSYLDTLCSAFEMIESGLTTVQHLHGWRGNPISRMRAMAEQVLKAYQDIGVRVSYSFALRGKNRLVYEADEAFVKRLPPNLAPHIAEDLQTQIIPLKDHPGLFVELWERWHGRERMRIQLAPANLHCCSDAASHAVCNYAAGWCLGMHVHLVETAYQKGPARRRTGTTAARYQGELALLGRHMTRGRGV